LIDEQQIRKPWHCLVSLYVAFNQLWTFFTEIRSIIFFQSFSVFIAYS